MRSEGSRQSVLSPPSLKFKRDATYDVLRGLAILTMLCANVVGYVSLKDAHPLWLRVYGSFAAPLFITLAGLVAALGVRKKGYGIGYFLSRGLLIFATGVLIDIAIWHIIPFTTYDVLYLIGFGFILLFFIEKLSLAWKIVVILMVFALAPILQHIFGYTDYPSEYYLSGAPTMQIKLDTPIWQHWLVDGWFPVFPWIGFAFLGSVMLDLKAKLGTFRDWRVAVASMVTGVIGVIMLWKVYFAQLMVNRGCYDEIFYPPTPAYILLAISAIGLLAATLDGSASHSGFFPLRVLGCASMFIYILHSALVQFVIQPYYADAETEEASGTLLDSLVVYGLVTLVCFLAALIIQVVKRRWKIRNFFFRFYFGS
jgi:uncharacterized membrane protein